LIGNSAGFDSTLPATAIPRSQLRRTARLGLLSSKLSTRQLWTSLRKLIARPERRKALAEAAHLRNAEDVLAVVGNMKGAVMKLAQIASFISDDVPEQYQTALRQLQTSAPPMTFALARTVVEAELGQPLERLFADFQPAPLAAASIGQVHAARLASGEEVVVKVQYPGVDAAIRADMANLPWLYAMLGMLNPGLDPKPLAAELQARITEELDYRREAENQATFARLFAGHPLVRVPRVVPERSGARVLTTARARGHDFEWLKTRPQEFRNAAGVVLFRFVFESIFRHHLFNGDPHPGNYLFHDDGGVTFLDFGCVKYFGAAIVADWKCYVRAHLAGDRETFLRQAAALGFVRQGESVPPEIYDYMQYFYEPWHANGPYTFTPEYNAQSLGMVFDRSHARWGPLLRQLNMPADFAIVNRLQWGLTSILSQLHATANWRTIIDEYLTLS
jgi:predicted unusual protein kinase regulating ubiquinone biosynthesis (AarF/ABC1/UbiB family)